VLRIRLTRTGRAKQESFRVVVAEHARPVKGKFIEVIGHYQPAKAQKPFDILKPRVEYWMSKGAQPSSSVAALLKKNGFANMEKYIAKRQSDIKKKSEQGKEGAAAPAAPAAEKEAPAAA
jgi:small subunit ribosomal protein S16